MYRGRVGTEQLLNDGRLAKIAAYPDHGMVLPRPFSSGTTGALQSWSTRVGPDTAVLFGGVLEVIVAFAGIGTAVALYPVLKRQNNGVALGLVGSRV